MMNLKNILHAELSYTIIGAAMDVHNELGPGWDEEAYHVAMLHALKSRGVKAESKLRGKLMHKGIVADRFELDILVEDRIILELKHLVAPFSPAHYCQLINYLKFWKKDLGILINFGLDRLKYARVPYSPVSGTIQYEDPKDKQSETQESINAVAPILHEVLNIHGLGYGNKTYQGLFAAECRFRLIDCERPFVELNYRECKLGEKAVDAFLVDHHLLVLITSLSEQSSSVDLARLLAYMKQLKTNQGILANFGKNILTLRPLTL